MLCQILNQSEKVEFNLTTQTMVWGEGKVMKAAIVFTGSGLLIVLTSFDSFSDSGLVEKFEFKGIKKYFGYELPLELCKLRYGEYYSIVAQDLGKVEDIRVLDYNGHLIFVTSSFSEFGQEFRYE
jgi:hypothetical protein